MPIESLNDPSLRALSAPTRKTTIVFFRAIASTITLSIFLTICSSASAEEASFPGEKGAWIGGSTIYNDKPNGRIVVVPPKPAEGKPWVWRARFWGHQPGFDQLMIEKGYHIVYRDVSNLYGAPEAIQRWDDFYNYLRKEHGFAEKAVLEGMSRGGLIVYNWASANPDKVAVIYGDAPVMDFKSWPGAGHAGILRSYSFKNEDEAKNYTGNPIDNLRPLAKAGIPIIHVVGDVDEVVPVSENTSIAEKRYRALGGIFEVIHKKDVGHKHRLKDPRPLVHFVIGHTK